MRSVNGSFNRYNTIFYYDTDTLHLQGALIHTALYTDTTYIYNTSTGRLQYRYITERLNTYGTIRR